MSAAPPKEWSDVLRNAIPPTKLAEAALGGMDRATVQSVEPLANEIWALAQTPENVRALRDILEGWAKTPGVERTIPELTEFLQKRLAPHIPKCREHLQSAVAAQQKCPPP